jgi:hypothetical protein
VIVVGVPVFVPVVAYTIPAGSADAINDTTITIMILNLKHCANINPPDLILIKAAKK